MSLNQSLAMLTMLVANLAASAHAASFDCSKAEAGSIEERVCKTPSLSAQDEQLATVYKQALAKAKNENPPTLKAEQRGWIKGRNDCWKASDQTQCVADSYTQRIAELQARYQLVPGKGPVHFSCDTQPKKELLATFYATQPATLIAEFGDRTSLMYAEPSGSGSKYAGGNESFLEHDGEAKVVWGYGAKAMGCKRK